MNALVEATPISAPARVINDKSDSRTNDDPSTLHIANEPRYPRVLAKRKAAKVSAVSPD